MPRQPATDSVPSLEPPWPDVVRHTVGNVSVDVAAQGFRNLAVDGRVVISELYPAVRAADWSTLDLGPAVDTLHDRPGSWRLTRDQPGLGGLLATTTLTVSPGPAFLLRYELRSTASAQVNRWGLNVCLDAQSWQGAAVTTAGEEHVLPPDISPQRQVSGRPQAMFPSSPTLQLVHPDGHRLALSSTGLVLEVEDQRNWTDPTYKVYSGSLQDPRPIVLEGDTAYVQELTLRWQSGDRLEGPAPPSRAAAGGGERPVPGAARELPRIGVQLNELPDGPVELTTLLSDLGVDHVRLDVERPHVREVLARLPPVSVELAGLAAGHGEREAELLAELVPQAPADVRVLWHLDGRRTTSAAGASAVERRLQATPRAAVLDVVPGTDAYFVDLNRDRPDVGSRVSFSISPTVHTDDSETVFASLGTQTDVVRQARTLFGADAVVSPITWSIRGAPEISHDAVHRVTDRRPDPRISTLEGAAWTVGSVHALLSADAESGTWHELFGATGMVELGDPDGVRPSTSFTPTFHALAALRASTRPLARAVGDPGSPWVGVDLVGAGTLLVASLRPWGQQLDRARLPSRPVSRRRLRPEDAASARLTARWWGDTTVSPVSLTHRLVLEPFEITLLGTTAAP